MKLFKPMSKPISKANEVIYYGGCHLEILKGKPIKSIWMKAKVDILKTCSIGTKIVRNKKNPFKKNLWK
jgi:hypothetical protein